MERMHVYTYTYYHNIVCSTYYVYCVTTNQCKGSQGHVTLLGGRQSDHLYHVQVEQTYRQSKTTE